MHIVAVTHIGLEFSALKDFLFHHFNGECDHVGVTINEELGIRF
jgi:hypothetical protein